MHRRQARSLKDRKMNDRKMEERDCVLAGQAEELPSKALAIT
jgi:hypothetical protein